MNASRVRHSSRRVGSRRPGALQAGTVFGIQSAGENEVRASIGARTDTRQFSIQPQHRRSFRPFVTSRGDGSRRGERARQCDAAPVAIRRRSRYAMAPSGALGRPRAFARRNRHVRSRARPRHDARRPRFRQPQRAAWARGRTNRRRSLPGSPFAGRRSRSGADRLGLHPLPRRRLGPDLGAAGTGARRYPDADVVRASSRSPA